MRSVSRLSQLKTLMAKQSDKSLRDELDSLVDLLKQVGPALKIMLDRGTLPERGLSYLLAITPLAKLFERPWCTWIALQGVLSDGSPQENTAVWHGKTCARSSHDLCCGNAVFLRLMQ